MSRLDDILRARVDLLDAASADFAADLDDVLAGLYRAVVELAQELEQSGGVLTRSPENVRLALGMIEPLRQMLDEAGYDEAARSYVDRYADVVTLVRDTYRVQDLPAAFSTVNRAAAEAARAADLAVFEAMGEESVATIRRALVQSVLYEREYTSLVQELKGTIRGNDKRNSPLANRANQFALSAVAEFDRTVTGMIADESEGTIYFRYYGPSDAVTRPWCKARLRDNKPRTREEINALPRSPTNVFGGENFISAGGIACRHAFVPTPQKRGASNAN